MEHLKIPKKYLNTQMKSRKSLESLTILLKDYISLEIVGNTENATIESSKFQHRLFLIELIKREYPSYRRIHNDNV